MNQSNVIHKRANAAPLSTGSSSTYNHYYAQGGSSSTSKPASASSAGSAPKSLPTPKRVRRRRKRPTANYNQDWIVLLLGFLILLGCSFWVFVKISDDSDPAHEIHNSQNRHHDTGDDANNIDAKKLKEMPYNELYHLPESHPLVGDRSDNYAKIRQKYDAILPLNKERSLKAVERLQKSQQKAADGYQVVPNEIYDIYNCPDDVPSGYPYAWPIMSLLQWSPDDTTIPDEIYQGLCVFHYQKDYQKAMTYRKAEVPFVVDGDPEVARTVERWNFPGFMQDLLGDVPHRTEHSESNKFLYYMPAKPKGRKHHNSWTVKTPPNYEPPTDNMRMPYLEWLVHANRTDEMGPNEEHWYYRLIGCGLTGPHGNCDKGSSEFLFDELPFFQPTSNLYMAEAKAQKGIHCRFGMKGIIAENHFDAGRNSIVLLSGSRRYILAHPEQCENLCLYPKGHPSARHSQVDYTNPDLDQFPQFAKANANEVVLQPGQVLYLPTHWFHYIISLELNMQCNTRSGDDRKYLNLIQDCGFGMH